MAIEIVVPRLGWSMDEGVFGEWLFKDGDAIRSGDMLFVLEGDKAAQEVESFDEGILRIPTGAPQPGAPVVVGQVLGFLCAEGEVTPELPSSANQTETEDQKESQQTTNQPVAAASQQPIESTTQSSDLKPAGPAARRLARQLGVSVDKVASACPTGRVRTEDVRAQRSLSPMATNRIRITPRARRAARELGIDWRTMPIAGSGAGGRIREKDIRDLASHDNALAGREIVISPMRRTIAERMLAAWHQAAPVTLNAKADATELLELRAHSKEEWTSPASMTDVLVKCVGMALVRHPMLKGQWHDDHILVPEQCDIGFAVQTDQGLVVPVLRNVDRMSLVQLASQSTDLVQRARGRQLDRKDMRGGVFTVSNLGSFGIETFSPILNLPQSAILGVGAIIKEPVVIDDEIVVRPRMSLSLTFDHRVIDGAPAAEFVAELVQVIETCRSLIQRSR